MRINLVLLFLVLAVLSANVFAQNTMYNLRVLDIDPGTKVYAKANSSGQLITSAVASEDGANLSIPGEVIFFLETDPDEYYISVNGNLKPIKEVKYVFHSGQIFDAKLSYCASFDYNFMGYPLSPYKQSDLKNIHGCFGPDPGVYDLFLKGSIIMYGGPYPKVAEDVCIDDNTVRKYWCENGYGKSIDLVCPEGHLCWDGLCFEGTHLVQCTDSDGYDFFKKGTVKVTNPDGDSYFEDSCDDESTLIETTCLGPNDIAHPEVITCPSGYSCSDGACITGPETVGKVKIKLVDYNDPSFIGPSFSGIKVAIKDSMTGNVIMEGTTDSSGIIFDVPADAEFYITTDPPVFGGVRHYVDGKYWSHSISDSTFWVREDGNIYSFNLKYYTGFKGLDLVLYKNFYMKGNMTCRDPYGFDVNRQSIAKEYLPETTVEWQDYCMGDSLVEFECPVFDSYVRATLLDCPNGCREGACTKAESSRCIGLQGHYELNIASEVKYNGETHKDYCTENNMAMKYWCLGENIQTTEVLCPEGYNCRSGACVLEGVQSSELKVLTEPKATGITVSMKDHYGNILAQELTDSTGQAIFYIKENQVFYLTASDGYADESHAYSGHPPTLFKLIDDEGEYELLRLLDGAYTLHPFAVVMHPIDNDVLLCRDSDGSNSLTQGSITYAYKTYEKTLDDICLNENSVLEMVCDNGNPTYTALDCHSTYYCDAGACTKNDADDSPGDSSTITDIQIYSGWNMISIPTTIKNVTSTCNGFDLGSLWMYNSFSGEYMHPGILSPGIGYWFHSTETCRIQARGSKAIPADISLQKGWNLIGSTFNYYSFNEIKGTCDFTKGPYSFSTASQSYTLATDMVPGQAYFIKVDESCYFSMEKNPPAPPEASTCSSTQDIGSWTKQATTNCNGGGYECMESPGCPDKVQRCGDGICTPQSSCDVIHWDNGSACNCTQDIGSWTKRATTNCNN